MVFVWLFFTSSFENPRMNDIATFVLFFTALKVDLKGQGCNDPPTPGRNCPANQGSIKVNGIERSPNRRGLNFVAYSFPAGKYMKNFNVDSHGDADAGGKVQGWINGLPVNTIVFVASKDEPSGRFNGALLNALVSFIFNF